MNLFTVTQCTRTASDHMRTSSKRLQLIQAKYFFLSVSIKTRHHIHLVLTCSRLSFYSQNNPSIILLYINSSKQENYILLQVFQAEVLRFDGECESLYFTNNTYLQMQIVLCKHNNTTHQV